MQVKNILITAALSLLVDLGVPDGHAAVDPMLTGFQFGDTVDPNNLSTFSSSPQVVPSSPATQARRVSSVSVQAPNRSMVRHYPVFVFRYGQNYP